MTDDEQSNESEDELRRRAEESFNTGVPRYRRGDYSEEWSSFENTLVLRQQGVPGTERDQADCLFNSGNALRDSGDWRGALERYERALALYRGLPGTERDQADCLFNSGNALGRLGDWRGALEQYERALALYRGLPGTERDQADCLFNSGVALGELGDLRGALERYERALALYRGLPGTERNQADCLLNSGVALGELGDWRGALERFERALALCRGLPGSERNQADCLFNSGNALRELGDLRGALERYERALALCRGVPGSERNQARCLFNSGVALGELGDWRGALERYERALALYRGLPGSERNQARCLFNSGVALGELGDWRGALERYERALALCRGVPGSERDQADCLFNSGNALGELGDWRGALERSERALALYRGLPGSERNQARCLNNSGVALGELGDWRGALERYERALALYRGLPGTERDQAKCLFNSGNALGESGDWRGALERYERALTLLDQHTPEADRIEVERTGARCVRSIGVCLVNLNEAVFPDHFTRALKVLRRPEHVDHTKDDQAACLRSIGGGRSATGDLNGAVEAYQQAQDLYGQVGQPERATEINVPLARVLKRKAAAIDSVFERLALLEESLNLTVEAALSLDRARFRLERLDDRQRWFQAHARSTMDLALEVAAELDRPHLISDLIATWRTVGTLDVPRTGPSRTAGGESRTSDQSVTATEHFTGANNAKEMLEEDEGSSLVAGPAVGSQTAIIAHLPRRPGPGLLMPHHRTALAGYDQAPARTAAYR